MQLECPWRGLEKGLEPSRRLTLACNVACCSCCWGAWLPSKIPVRALPGSWLPTLLPLKVGLKCRIAVRGGVVLGEEVQDHVPGG